MEYGCGQCLPCRINRRRTWTARLLLEAQCHEASCFLTLTYSDKKLPSDLSLSIRHYQLFLKKLRFALAPRRISFYIVGEYGSRTDRPHYHAVIFGFSPESRGQLVASKIDRPNYYGDNDRLVLSCWGNGDVHVGDVNDKSMMYAVKHLTKGWKNGVCRADGRQAEFARMSLRPAIGKVAMEKFADLLCSQDGSLEIARTMDVPRSFRVNGSLMGFGRYLRRVLRRATGGEDAWHEVARYDAMFSMLERYSVLGPSGMDSLRLRDLRKAQLSKATQNTRL